MSHSGEVLGQGRLLDLKTAGQLADGLLPHLQLAQDHKAVGVSQQFQQFRGHFGRSFQLLDFRH